VPHALDETLISTRRPEVRQSQPAGALLPLLDGEIAPAEEWAAAGVHRAATMGSMHRASTGVRTIHFGQGGERIFVLVETAPGPARELLESATLVVSFPGPEPVRYRVQGEPATGDGPPSRVPVTRERFIEALGWVTEPTRARAAANTVVELEVPLRELQPGPDQTVGFRVLVLQGATELERHPDAAPIAIDLEEVTRV
jgi:hypothetical protein